MDDNFRRFPYLNIDLGKVFYPPLFELCDKDVDVIIPLFSLSYAPLHHENGDWLHAGQFAQNEQRAPFRLKYEPFDGPPSLEINKVSLR